MNWEDKMMQCCDCETEIDQCNDSGSYCSKDMEEAYQQGKADAIDEFAIWCDNNGIDFSASYPSEIIAMFNEDMRNGYQIKEQTNE